MIEYRNLDITTVKRGIVAHGVNCQKKMGSGVAAAIKARWPKAYDFYVDVVPVLGIVRLIEVENGLWVANCYTQDRYGYDGKRYASPGAIETCLNTLSRRAYILRQPIYMPKIGCGLGGLDWERDVKPVLENIDSSYLPYDDVQFVVCDK